MPTTSTSPVVFRSLPTDTGHRPVGKAAVRSAGAPSAFSVVVLDQPADLIAHSGAWNDLARHALEPNVFCEPWALLPALRAFGPGHELLFVLVYAADRGPASASPLLCGFFPLERRHGYRGLPLRYLTLWQHAYCYFGAPLLRADQASDCLSAFLSWARLDRQGAAVVALPNISGEGPLRQLLIEHGNRHGTLSYVAEAHSRALFRPRRDAQTYLETALASKRRKDFRRKENALAGQGRLEVRVLRRAEELPVWLDAFLHLESGGWKGRQGTAMAQRQADRFFFHELASLAFHQGQLLMLGLFLDDRPVALKCNFLSGPGSFAFKIAFDESCARSSPGALLELANIRHLHELPHLEWMDSCAAPDQTTLNRLWLDRRIIQTVLLSTGRLAGDLVVSALPLLRWLKRRLSRSRTPLPQEPEPAGEEG
jgi:CelD/BcsL family acetyltransferase involved in cellulose biosynthesis